METSEFFLKSLIFEQYKKPILSYLSLRKTLFLIFLVFSVTGNICAQSTDPLQRAIKAIGGDAALERASSISVFMAGTQDRKVIDQGYFAAKPLIQRQQETLIVDESSRRAVFRSEGSNSDGSPNVWRYAMLGDSGYWLNLKSGRTIKMNKERTAVMYEGMRWRIPQFALADMKRRRDKLRCGETRSAGKQVYDLCRFETEAGTMFSVLFSRRTGHLTAYEYIAPIMRGPKLMRYEFKTYVISGIGLFPSGYRFTIGNEVYKDLNLTEALPAVLEEHPWFAALPAESKPVSGIAQQPPASTQEVAPGVWFLRNVAGYNAMFARVGDCVAVFDAPASYGILGDPLPSAEKQPDRSAIIMNKVLEITGKKVCYVIPTHHHNDHFGGIAGFALAGATIITPPQSLMLARMVVKAADASVKPKIKIVQEKMTLGSGDERIDIRVISNDPHAEAMVFIHLPGRGIVFEGDLSDYVPSAWNFLRFIRQKDLKVERVFSVHSAQPHQLEDIQWEEPSN